MDTADDFNVFLGGDGVPFFTKKQGVPSYKNSFPQRMQPQDIRKVRVDVLDLANDAQYRFYLSIWEAVGYSICTVVEEDRKWIEKKENWKVFIRWYLHGKMSPEELRASQLDAARGLSECRHQYITGQQPGTVGDVAGQLIQTEDNEEWL